MGRPPIGFHFPPARPAGAATCAAVLAASLTLGSVGEARAQRIRGNVGLGVATAYDSNLDHRFDAVPGMSLAASGNFELRYAGRWAGIQLGYNVAHHRYEGEPERNRTTQGGRGVLSLTPGEHVTLTATVEAAFRTLSEDRELGTQFGLIPRLEIRPDARNRLRLHSLHRVRRFGELSGNDLTNHGGGIDYRIGGRAQPTLELGTGYDQTMTADARSRFNRWTHRVTFAAPLGSAVNLTLGARQTTRTYPDRLVALESLANLELLPEELRILEGYTLGPADPAGLIPFEDIPDDELLRWRNLPRRDEIWAPYAALAWRVIGIEWLLAYDLEIRMSNDLRHGYTAHSLELGSRWRLR